MFSSCFWLAIEFHRFVFSSSFMYNWRKRQVWGVLIVIKWWQIFQFWMNYAFNIFVETDNFFQDLFMNSKFRWTVFIYFTVDVYDQFNLSE